MLGREFLPNEASRPGLPATDSQPARPPVPATAVIIGHTLCERQYGRDPNIIGKTGELSDFSLGPDRSRRVIGSRRSLQIQAELPRPSSGNRGSPGDSPRRRLPRTLTGNPDLMGPGQI